ncbi:imidazolonepropionase [Paralimibaculum aggregatum]|uniref:Imidazolonepropionase n=1 Tax=Paralimibaculum aggregatum TaxID=3036245 RepID=A0ABQ6LTC0_9RHOB|nr:imidazolonepropionase [Limibaculum sp. NKW23]GMG85329.1 imidazolonepropionase [Limibaculum sp. NKW23]
MAAGFSGGQVLTGLRLATMAAPGTGTIPDGVIAIRDGHIAFAGPAEELPREMARWPGRDYGGRLATPALIDCHTHLVFGGHRAREFALRLEGASYEEIARAGGGIRSTVTATRSASDGELLAGALTRLDAMIAEGVATVEIKSGYGLDLETELRMLRVARALGQARQVRVVTTCLAAHALPEEYTGRSDAYIDLVCDRILPAAAAEGLADAVDGFCEGIAFSPEQMARVFAAARALGLPVKLHAEQLSNLGGAALAARHGALSADHLEYLDAAGVQAMAAAGTVAVLLPGAFYTLRETQAPPVALLREAGVPIAVATDANPGSSPMTSLILALNMACTLLRLTPDEALGGATREAARALGLGAETGTIEAGKAADIAIWNIETPEELAYRIGDNPLHQRLTGGRA